MRTIAMNSRQTVWQLQWHEILNDYPDPDGGASATRAPLLELESDFRLHFNLWQVPLEARLRAFAIFPCGTEMLHELSDIFLRSECRLRPNRQSAFCERAFGLRTMPG